MRLDETGMALCSRPDSLETAPALAARMGAEGRSRSHEPIMDPYSEILDAGASWPCLRKHT